MKTVAFFVCVQAFLVQNALSQCLGAPYGAGLGYGPLGPAGPLAAGPLAAGPLAAGPMGAGLWGAEAWGAGPMGYPAGPLGLAPEIPYGPAGFAGPLAGAYGGEGIGDVSVLGEMPVAGTTMVAGQVPILGAVRFAGDLPAGGVVTIAGSCGCGNGFIY